MAGLLGSSQAVLEGSLQLSGSRNLSVASNNRVNVARPVFSVRAQQVSFETETSRRAVLGLVAIGLGVGSFAKDGLAAATSIKVGPPPPPSGGLRKSLFVVEIRYSSTLQFITLIYNSNWLVRDKIVFTS